MKGNLYLIGFMGAGKSTAAERLGRLLCAAVFETDAEIAREAGMSIPEIFAREGEEGFRNRETEILRRAASYGGLIVSCGGGIVLREENVRLMKESGTVVWLTVSAAAVLSRTEGSGDRPLLAGKKSREEVEEMIKKRSPLYEAARDLEIATDGKDPETVAEEIRSYLHPER